MLRAEKKEGLKLYVRVTDDNWLTKLHHIFSLIFQMQKPPCISQIEMLNGEMAKINKTSLQEIRE